MKKKLRVSTIGLRALILLAVAASVVSAESKTPTQAYLDYQAALAKATKLSDVLPHLSAAYRGMLESRSKEDQPVWLKRLKDDTMKDIKIVKETIDGDKCTIQATGTSARGNAMKGKISMVKEGGAWKLEGQGWST